MPAKIRASPETFLHKGLNQTGAFSSEDVLQNQIMLDRTTNTNQDGKVPHRSFYNSSTVIVQFEFEFVERQYTLTYNGIMDIVSTLGGINGFIGPAIKIFTPVFILFFLLELSKIIQEKFDMQYKGELEEIFIKCHSL